MSLLANARGTSARTKTRHSQSYPPASAAASVRPADASWGRGEHHRRHPRVVHAHRGGVVGQRVGGRHPAGGGGDVDVLG
ncbi:MAG TPA: hypothetical protein VM386_03500, partial [Acidimicrobiales bacterium]|nr:hypothetical protein [Acidimicrobiales bacterium]